MASIKIDNVNILGMAAAVPKNIEFNLNEKFVYTTGVSSKRIASDTICTSDLCFEAATQLIDDLSIDKSEIEILVFISQTPDYKLPVTSTILQSKLGLPQSCICLDIPLGCSGYVYGLSVISSMINSGKLKKGMLLVGDTVSKIVKPGDQSTEPLFGDAGTATLLEYNVNSNPMLFELGSDGNGYDAIIIPGGGFRNSYDSEYLDLKGMDVFNFGISKIPKVFNNFLNQFNIDKEDIDLYVFHQANKLMNDKIYKKLSIPIEKTISSLYDFGNTSSASIPLTLITNSKLNSDTKLLLCGFGVGLSWGTVYIELNNNLHYSNLKEI
jgi:3-oxoacyl-[acyl-carrier-protein] synthase III